MEENYQIKCPLNIHPWGGIRRHLRIFDLFQAQKDEQNLTPSASSEQLGLLGENYQIQSGLFLKSTKV